MKIAVVPNITKDADLVKTKKIISLLLPRADIIVSDAYRRDLSGCLFVPENDLYSQSDIIITLGGDGTLLDVARKAALYGKSVLCVNLGRLGFLTGSEEEYFFTRGYKKIFENFRTEERMMIQADVFHADGSTENFYALNDIVVARSDFACVENIDVFVDGAQLGNYLADGVIVSTPTGSTAYSLSAGGPVLDPELDAFVVTPICPHMLHTRPVVIPPHKEIQLVKTAGENTNCAVTVDGKNGCMLYDGEYVVIKKSEYVSRLIFISEKNFYDVLHEKLQ